MTPVQARTALRAAGGVVTYRYPHLGALAEHAWRLGDNLSFSDALYVALAARLGLSLVTGDRRLGGAPGLPCPIELVPAS